MKSIPSEFYKSTAWKRCRDAYMRYRGGLCERCLTEGKYVPADIVHHKDHLTMSTYKDPEKAFGFDNLEAVCQACHNQIHSNKPSRRWVFTTEGLNVKQVDYL